MEKKSVINVRGFDCPPDSEEQFNKWYSEIHIPMLLESGEINAVTSFKRIGNDEKYPKYLVIYQFANLQSFERYEASPQLAAAIKDSKDRWPEGSFESRWRIQYEAVESWKK